MVTFYKALHNVLFIAGYLSVIVLASVISYYGRKDIGLSFFIIASVMYLLLLVLGTVINRQNSQVLRSATKAGRSRADAPPKLHSLYASASYNHDAHTVWSLIRPAESATFLSDAQRAFTVPGTPPGVGEQQCFIRRDGSVSVIEVIGEEGPWWATTRPIAQDASNQRYTYRLEPAANGCTLTIGAVIEHPANTAFTSDQNEWWESYSRNYLDRIGEVLSARRN
ncbi:hypothetical protein ACFFGR_17095 [Arthrobacter liuii]|uniref:Polyketide cyclase / dehydrase and lipid transport n=1 Tax=Arthrobacter liuii TaxID=1476996 RepID=A0ABQ2AY96_9MICC|nr:hypothetical protein [Arthrobacter liuii]GGI01594.1 hypothetical protein GCM10007170_41390 [Arthrobacter liuii]